MRFIKDYVRTIPVPEPTQQVRDATIPSVSQLIEVTEGLHAMRHELLDWLGVEHIIEKPSQKLQSPTELDSDALVAEVKRVRGKKNPLAASFKCLRDKCTRTIEPARVPAADVLRLERQLSDLASDPYGLTPASAVMCSR